MDSSDDSKSFLKHVFNFDDDSKSDVFNIIQYALIAIIPVVILNKTIGKYVPEADDKKGSLELSAEIVIQVIVTFIGLLLIHRMITYIPTYSNTKYADFNIMYIILAILMITMSLQTKLGEKVSILSERVSELWNGPSDKKKKKGSGAVKVSQPIAGQQILQPMPPTYTDGTAISALPTSDSQPDSTQQLPNYNNMYRQDTTPLVAAATPGMTEGFGPVAASEFLGSGGLGSAW
jgi:hypothetical protein